MSRFPESRHTAPTKGARQVESPRLIPRSRSIALGVAAAIAVIVACTTATDGPAAITAPAQVRGQSGHEGHNGGELTRAQLAAIARVRNATARFHDIEVANAAGYSVQYPAGCAASPDGAQGYHWLNSGLVDDKVELLKPELVMYEPKRGGGRQLVGVDYVVPFDKWTSSTPPTLLGVPFMRNEPLGVWALHIWAWRPNPSGMFAAWNPNVSCARAS